nr:DNA repair protein RecO C-terminal domain-containing protein [Halodesulfovibrio sp. MK-HDV]
MKQKRWISFGLFFFRARFAFDQGYSPELNICQICANDLKYPVFHVQEGVLTCAACAQSQGPRFRLSKESLDALRFVQENSPLRWSELNLSMRARKELSRAIDGFIQYHIGLSWENGMFRRV